MQSRDNDIRICVSHCNFFGQDLFGSILIKRATNAVLVSFTQDARTSSGSTGTSTPWA